MRKYIIWGLVLITLIFGITVILRGSKIFNFNILSYGQIGERDKELDRKIEELKQKSTIKYNGAKADLNKEVKEFFKDEFIDINFGASEFRKTIKA